MKVTFMRKRKKLTIQDILSKKHYRAILYLISLYQEKKIQFLHLRYAFVENHEILINPRTQKNLEQVFGNNLNNICNEELLRIKIKGKRGINNLTNFLRTLKNLEMIATNKEPRDRFPSYRLTDLGEKTFGRWYLKWIIDWLIPDEALEELAQVIGELSVKYIPRSN